MDAIPPIPAAPVFGDFVRDAPGEWQPRERDPEMMAVFLAEARQMLDALREALPRLAGGAANPELLAGVRRCFHTFKGSGRMLGLAALSDAAHAVERLLNACLAQARAAGPAALAPPVLALLENSRLLLEEWIGELAMQGGSYREAPSLVAAALALCEGMAAAQPGQDPRAPIVTTAAAATTDVDADPRLRAIYLDEARQLLKTMRQHGSSWRAKANSGLVAPAPPLFMRAVHTLRGSSATAGFAGMRELAGLLEDLLEQVKAAAAGLDGSQLAAVENAVDAMHAMLEQYRQGGQPAAPAQAGEALSALLGHFRRQRTGREEAGAASPPPAAAVAEPAIAPEAGAGELRDEIDHDLLPVFLEEGQDLLAAVGEGLHRFQRDPSDSAAIAELRRPLHTVKGSARMAGALRLGHLMHELESGVQRALRGQGGADAAAGLLALYDKALKQFEALERLGGADGASAPLRRLSEGERKLASPLVRIKVSVLDQLLNQVGEVSIARSQLENEVDALHKSAQELAESIAKLADQLRDVEIQAEIQMAASHHAGGESARFDPLELDRFTHLQELTRMMAENVGDAASLQKQLVDAAGKTQEGLRRQGRLTRELQQELMYTRMVKFNSLEQRLQHLVRQLSNETGKPLALEIGGGDVELDRGILERMIGPFEHLLRNAAVHGIEAGDGRLVAGKPAAGRLSVRAAQEGSEAIIRIADDGRGLDLAAIRSKGEALGLVGEDIALDDARVSELIFEPGFSTSSEISALAGRGVGMDVVRSEVTALGGRVMVESQPGAGTHFTIHLPLSLAVKQVCLLRQGGQTYAIPSMLVDKVVQLRGARLQQALAEEALDEGGRRVALQPLERLLDQPLGEDEGLPQASGHVLFVKGGNELVAILVDQVLGNREVVAKPLGPQLDTLAGVVGATVLGNGEIALIVNPLLLARRTGTRRLAGRPAKAAPRAGRKLVMVVDDSLTVRKVTQRLLVREGYAVATATDGYDAIGQLHDRTPDIFLVDIEMPRMDGFTLVRHLRDNESTRAKPIIMITSRTGAKHRERAMEVGVNHYMGKPYQDEKLLALVRHFTGDPSRWRDDDFRDVLY
ncbi:Hpt domain-containing protein [Herbaspirillum sp.]|uniref:hybrid sensor histidine kinase/response regulator n=1 Tax=Herbaspirillum sp. TaxID=1890675 RepID=UPI0031CDDAC6